jgi:hypothetical protein
MHVTVRTTEGSRGADSCHMYVSICCSLFYYFYYYYYYYYYY